MDIREYRQYAESKHGKKSINDGMLRAMDRATGGKNLSKGDWNDVNAKIKMKSVAVKGD